ncbi:MAG: glycohydrolase toxin TNT-related protein, partial [Lutisporaceae bacterium]
EITDEDFELGYITYEEKPDYLLDPTSKATYKYDANGNRINYVTDNEALDYEYDAADRLLSDGNDSYSYDANGNMTGVQAGEDTVEYIYNAANKLTEVKYPDGTYVKYGYDAFGRKVSREEAYWNKEADDAPGKSEYAPGQNKEKNNNGNGNSNSNSNKKEKVNPLKLKTDTTTYLYDGFTNAITNEYTGNGSPLSQYYMANDRVVSKKTFGNHGLVIPGREPSLKTDGGLMYYSYDGMRNVTELTDRHGDSIEQYRYDAFGGLYTGVTAPYNTNGFAGKSYDAKANLIDMNARWYGAQNGRFTTADPYTGDILTPYTQNRYAYVGNNPINRWDPLGYWMAGDDDLSAKAVAKIAEYEKEYYAATTDEGRTAAHTKADYVRTRDRDRWTTEAEQKISSWSGTPDIDREAPYKWSDGWRTDWTRIDKYYVKYEVTASLHTGFAGVISTTVSNRTDTTTTVTNGFDYRAFTPSEWYQENKAVLRQYNIPISQVNSYYEPKDAYSKTTSSSRSITSTEKIVSRNDNNDFKNNIISQGLEVAGVSNKIVGIDKDKGTGKDDDRYLFDMEVNNKYAYAVRDGYEGDMDQFLQDNPHLDRTPQEYLDDRINLAGTVFSLYTLGMYLYINGKPVVDYYGAKYSTPAPSAQAVPKTQWYKPDGSINYPLNNGAVAGTEVSTTLQKGQSLGRYGNITPKSDYVTNTGASPSSLSLPPNTDASIYTEYVVVKPIPNTIQSTVAPWGGDVGGGLQYKLPTPIEQLLKEGYIIKK